jgi:hypothetical protein
VYTSAHSHSSVDKAALVAGFGRANVRVVPHDAEYAMRPDALRDAIDADRRAGAAPCPSAGRCGAVSNEPTRWSSTRTSGSARRSTARCTSCAIRSIWSA